MKKKNNSDPDKLTKQDIDNIIVDQNLRRTIARESHNMFFHLYFHEFTKYKTADFQKEMFGISENNAIRLAVIVAFRGSAKSTIMTMSYPIWAILGKLQKKCVVILSQTQQQVRTHFTNIKRELESNELLRADLGPFREESDEWGSYSLVIPRFNARIVGASSEQSIRGIRHGAYRPDLIICDDVEDLSTVKTKEGRDKIHSWFTGEILPLGDKETKIIVVGNLLHEDSLLMRIKTSIQEGNLRGIYKEYPLVSKSDKILWKGKFQNKKEIREFKSSIGDEKAWQREYMLNIIADEDQIIKREWIQTYDSIPQEHFDYTAIGIDLAISEKSTADYSAMVVGHVFRHDSVLSIYIDPFPFNKRVDFDTMVKSAKDLARTSSRSAYNSKLYVEDIGFQKVYIEQLSRDGFDVKGFNPNGQDKRARLATVSHLIKNARILFPRNGAEELINQMVYLGVEKHDDLCDAFTTLVHMEMVKKYSEFWAYFYSEKYGRFIDTVELKKLEKEEEKLTDFEKRNITYRQSVRESYGSLYT